MMTLKEVREKNGLTQEKLALQLGVERGTISMIEIGKNRMTVPMAKKVEKLFGVKWTEFFED